MIKSKKGQIVELLVIMLVIIVLFYVISNALSLEREVILINIQDRSFEETGMGFQRTTLLSTFFDKYPEGDLRLYIEAHSMGKGETEYTYSKESVGEGLFFISDVTFPNTDDTWLVRFELKDQQHNTLDRNCYSLVFTVREDGKAIETQEANC